MTSGVRQGRSGRPVAGLKKRVACSRLVYAVGDVHGRLDLLNALISEIRKDWRDTASDDRPLIVFLGDLIDRGPHSAECVSRVIALAHEDWCDLVALKGNHEEALLLYIDDRDVGRQWLPYGGAQTLESYGVNVMISAGGGGFKGLHQAFLERLPQSHRTFYAGLPTMYRQDDYLFVHAGVRPGVALDCQTDRDLMWIREPFLSTAEPLADVVVVHGHTPVRAPELLKGRINVDTGAYASGVLTALRLRGFERGVVQVRSARAAR